MGNGLGTGRVADSGSGVYHIAHTAFLRSPARLGGGLRRRHGNDGKPLLLGIELPVDSIALGTGGPGGCADNGLLLGYGVVRLGKRSAIGVAGGCADMGSVQGIGAVGLEKRDAIGVVGG